MADFVGFHRLALAEYRKARSWYARKSRRASHRFVQAVNRGVNQSWIHRNVGRSMIHSTTGTGCRSFRTCSFFAWLVGMPWRSSQLHIPQDARVTGAVDTFTLIDTTNA